MGGPRQLHVLNLGAGVQSTTLYLMYMRGLIQPAVEAAIFADTQDEPRVVYEHVRWLQTLGGPPIHIVTAGCIGNDLINGRNSTGQRFASRPPTRKVQHVSEHPFPSPLLPGIGRGLIAVRHPNVPRAGNQNRYALESAFPSLVGQDLREVPNGVSS